MKKVIFCVMCFLMFVSVSNATINDVSFVGGTGGSKILDLSHENNRINTSGVIYDKDASLVYEITYTNDTDYNKKIADVNIPNNKQLKYKIIDLDSNKVISPGETVKFKYSIYSADDKSFEELESLNETAEFKLSLNTVIVSNPNTVDLFFVAVLLFLLSIVCFRIFKTKKTFYASFILFLLISLFTRRDLVLADEKEMVQINTNIKYILSNLAPSCANTNYNGDFCIDWKAYGNRDVVNYLVMEDTKELPSTYNIGDVNFTLQSTHDVSEQQNGEVTLGVYKVNDQESYLFLVGQDGGVVVPKDASYQFSSYDAENNNSVNDFKYVKYADFSKFYSNKTTNMSYMLTGIGTISPIEKLDLSGFETSNVTDMSYMFMGVGEYTPTLEIDLSHFDTSNVKNMEGMFLEYGYKSDAVKLDLSNFDTGNVTNMKQMFFNFGVYSSDVDLDIYSLDTSSVEDMEAMFYGFNCLNRNFFNIDYFREWDTSNVTDMSYMFSMSMSHGFDRNDYWEDKAYSNVDLTGLDFDSVVDMSYMFSTTLGIQLTAEGDIDTSNVKYMKYMFSLTTLYGDFDFTKFDTDSAIDVSGLFEGLYYATELDVTSFNFSNVEIMDSLFSTFNGKVYNLDKMDVSKVKSMDSIFNYYANLDPKEISSWDLSSVENFGSMFRCVKNVEVLDLSNLNFVNGTDYSYMFINFTEPARVLEVIDISGSDWNEEAVVEGMFYNLDNITIYVKDEKAKEFIEKQAPDCTVLIKDKE